MTTLSRVFQEAAAHGSAAVEQGAHAAEEAAPDIGGMLMHHLVDARELELPWGVVHLPQWDPIHVAGLTIDLSPTKHVIFLVLAALLCGLIFVGVGRVMQGKYRDKAPGGFANAMEAMILYFRDEIVRRNIGHGADGFTPYILTLFFFILTMNLLGLVPWGATATGNLSVTAALAVVSLIVIEISGFLALGPSGYAKTIFYAPKGLNPVAASLMLVIMTPVELMGKLAKPFALAIRLFANMTAGHTVILSLVGLIFVFGNLTIGRWGIAAGSVGMSLAMMLLEIFVAFLQAYIFAMLTSVFIGLIRHAH
ncbi:F0F1 ATP synthase subunit A [Gemmatimonadota bacterium]